ncbi:ribosomal-protein-alanine N-acetyltransferase [Chitinophaga sp. S165]|nr:ribosomal-protein-alanine N-acetyltransferase [Chitinophaga sp. S165]
MDLKNDTILLHPLTEKDAAVYYQLYCERADEQPFLPDETPWAFTTRILNLCNCLFTIRLRDRPEIIIGDCALHDWNQKNKEIEIGGSLFKAYQGKGYMQSTFTLLMEYAGKHYQAKKIIGKTQADNNHAIRLVEKLGFQKEKEEGNVVMLSKAL